MDGEGCREVIVGRCDNGSSCSVLYEKGIHVIEDINNFIGKWMDSKAFKTIGDYRGMLSYSSIENPDLYERAQFMKYFSNKQY